MQITSPTRCLRPNTVICVLVVENFVGVLLYPAKLRGPPDFRQRSNSPKLNPSDHRSRPLAGSATACNELSLNPVIGIITLPSSINTNLPNFINKIKPAETDVLLWIEEVAGMEAFGNQLWNFVHQEFTQGKRSEALEINHQVMCDSSLLHSLPWVKSSMQIEYLPQFFCQLPKLIDFFCCLASTNKYSCDK